MFDQIRQNWAYVVWPRADRLELTDARWNDALAAAFPDHRIENLGDNFNYSKCHTYTIMLQPGRIRHTGTYAEEMELIAQLGGRYVMLLLKLSAVVPYYLLTLLVRTLGAQGTIVEQHFAQTTPEEIDLWRRAQDWAESQGFAPIPEEYLTVVVPGAELELADPGKVTIYNCLFEDEATL